MKKVVFVKQDNCIPCRQLIPVFEKAVAILESGHGKNVAFRYVDVTDDWATATRLNIQTTPTIIVFDDEVEIGRLLERRLIPLVTEMKEYF